VQVALKSIWHRDNWPLTTEYRAETRFFHCRPILFLSDVDDLSFGPTEYLPGTHLRSPLRPRVVGKQGEGLDGVRTVPMLGKAGDLWLMASRVLHRRAFDTAGVAEGVGPKFRRVAWMVCKTELPHP
jgi:hypothetical protein